MAIAAALAASSARAQSASSTLSSYRTGYSGAGLTGLDSPISPSLVSSASQYGVSDGVNASGAVGSVFSSQPSGGTSQSATGVGQTAAATSNERSALTTVEALNVSAASAHDAGSAPKAQATTGGLSLSSPSANATATNDIVLNGKVNLDGGQ